MKKVRIAESLSEMLQNYAYEVEEGERDNFHDDHILDGVLDMHEVLHKDGVEEGRFCESFMLKTDKNVKVFETVEVERFMSGTKEKLKVMSILDVKPLTDGQMMVEFLGTKVRD